MKYMFIILSLAFNNHLCANEPEKKVSNEVSSEIKTSDKESKETKIISNNESVSLSFEKIEIPQLIELVYSDVLKTSYIMHDEVLKKINHVTIRLKSNHKKSELNGIMNNLLQDYGISIDKKDKYVSFRLTESKEEKKIPMFYKPKHRSTAYLLSMISGTIDARDSMGQKRNAEQSNKDKKNESEEGLNKLVTKEGDGLLIMTTQKKIDLIMQLLKEIDIPEKQVHIQALVYEVQSSNNDSNAIQAVLKTIGKIGLNISTGASRGAGQIFEVSTKDLSVLMNIFNADNQFKVITSPSLFVKSGQKANFSVGTETPTLSGIKYPDSGNSGTPVQGVEYRKSGTIFEVKPKIHEETIDLEINQEISNFVATTTGVSNSPTLIKRALKSEFSMKSGQMVILAGLKEKKDTLDSTYLPFTKWEVGREKTHTESEIVLILHCQLVDEETNKSNTLNFNDFIYQIPNIDQPLNNVSN